MGARFHDGPGRRHRRGLCAAGGRRGLDTAVLSGGVFQNRVLLERTAARLERARACGCSRPSLLPPNDGGISYGQAAVAAARAVV